MWNKYLDVGDSETCRIGSIFVFLGPNPITELYCNDIILMTPSSGLNFILEPCIGGISDVLGTISYSTKTVSFQVTGKIALKNLSVTNCNCDGFFCHRLNLQDN